VSPGFAIPKRFPRRSKTSAERLETLPHLAEERERRHKAELAALGAQMQAKLDALTRANEALTCRLGKREHPSQEQETEEVLKG
jgi:hypothetical protein